MTIIEDIKEKLDMVAWIGKRVELKRVGRRWTGLCPFHAEKTGSFFVFEESQRWKCFGCDKSGDLLDFAQEVEGWTLAETIQRLAQEAGLELRPLTEAEHWTQQTKRDRETVFGKAAEFLQIATVEEKTGAVTVKERAHAGYEYARGRGFEDRTMAKARLGWFGRDWGALREALLDAKVDIACPAAVALLGYSGNVADWGREWRVEVDTKWVEAGRIPAMPPEMLIYVHYKRGTVEYLSGRRVGNEKGPKSWNPPAELGGEKTPLFNATWRETTRGVIVEGQACAWTLEQWSIGAVANLGTEFHASTPNPLLDELLKKEELFIALDADDAGRRGATAMAERLLKAGRTAVNVRVVTWPKHDANDWLQDGATMQTARALLEAALTWLDVLVGRAQEAHGTEREEATRAVFYALATLDEYGVLRQRDRVCEILEMKKGEFDALLKSIRRELGLNEDGKPKYLLMNGRVCHRYTDRFGAESINPLCNFTATIAEDLLLDDGEVQVREFGMTGAIGERTLFPARVEASEFVEMNWVAKAWGSRAIVEAGGHAREHLRAAIQYLSEGVQMKTVYTHTGWREIGGKPVYLSGLGGTPPAGGDDVVIVELDKGLELYAIPATPTDAADAVRTSLEFLEVAPRAAAWPLWGAMYVAPLREMVNLAFVLWLYAPTGAMKSTLAALAMNHYGEGFDDKHLPAGFIDTANSVERRMFVLKDAPLVVDDFAPQKDPTAAREYTKTAHRLVRAAGNLAGRGRLRADAKARQTYMPRCLTLVTGEDLPESEGVMGRLFVVEMQRGDIDIARLTALQEKRGRLSHAMSSYLAWLAERWEWITSQAPEIWRKYRKDAQCIGKHLRLPEAVAGLFLGCELGLMHAQSVGAITEARYKELREDAWQALVARARAMGERLLQEKPEVLFVDVLRTLLTQGKVFLRDRESLKPPLGGPDDGNGAEMLGWYDQTRAYLLPQATYNRVYRYFHDQGNVFPVREQTLRKQLDEAGLLAASDDGRRTSTLWVDGHTERVLIMELGKLWGEEASQGQDS